MTSLLDVLKQAVIVGDADRAAELAERCLAEGMPAQTLFEQAIVAGIQETGRLWDANRYYVPDVILSADAFRQATRVVERQMGQRRAGRRGKVVIGVVEGDVHDLGKGIVVASRGQGEEADGGEVTCQPMRRKNNRAGTAAAPSSPS